MERNMFDQEIIMKRKNLGLFIQETLTPEIHEWNIWFNVYDANKYCIKVTFSYMGKSMMRKIITIMMWPRLEYAIVVWFSHMKMNIKKLERIQEDSHKDGARDKIPYLWSKIEGNGTENFAR